MTLSVDLTLDETGAAVIWRGEGTTMTRVFWDLKGAGHGGDFLVTGCPRMREILFTLTTHLMDHFVVLGKVTQLGAEETPVTPRDVTDVWAGWAGIHFRPMAGTPVLGWGR